MKLLFDENLSPRLVAALGAEFPESAHVRDLDMRGSTDERIWQHAARNGFVICSKDNDFRQRSFTYGFPPKVIWLEVGNAGTDVVETLLRREQHRLLRFAEDEHEALIVLSHTVI